MSPSILANEKSLRNYIINTTPSNWSKLKKLNLLTHQVLELIY